MARWRNTTHDWAADMDVVIEQPWPAEDGNPAALLARIEPRLPRRGLRWRGFSRGYVHWPHTRTIDCGVDAGSVSWLMAVS